LIAGSGTATTTALGAYIALSKPGGTSILWIPLTISIIAVIVAGFAAGAAIYWTGKKELRESERADREASKAATQGNRADRVIARRGDILSTLEGLADFQGQLVVARPDKRSEYIGRFKERAVENAVSVTRLLQESDAVEVRAILIEYDVDEDGRPHFVRGPMSGQHPLIDLRLQPGADFSRAALKFIDNESTLFYVGDSTSTHQDIAPLRFPDSADHFLRARVVSGRKRYGIMCVDTWGTTVLARDDISPVLAIVKLLAAGLAALEEIQSSYVLTAPKPSAVSMAPVSGNPAPEEAS
jgi:hypothetical protein